MAGNCESAEGGNPPDLQSRHGGNPPHDSQPPQSSSSPPPPTKPPPQQFQLLFISQEALGQVKGSEEEVPKLPPIIPGYMASNFTLAIPEKVDEAIKELRYIDYSLLTRSGRGMVTKSGDSSLDWVAAARTVEGRTFHYHGAARSDPLKAHHGHVAQVACKYGWGLAQIYDQKTRELMAKDPRHDPSILNQDIITEANIFCRMEQLKASMLAHQSQSIQSIVPPLHAPPSLSNVPTMSHSTKRFNPYDKAGRQPKSAMPKPRRPRRRATGHTSEDYGLQ